MLDPSLESSLDGMCLFASGGFGGAGLPATSAGFTGGKVSRQGFRRNWGVWGDRSTRSSVFLQAFPQGSMRRERPRRLGGRGP